MINKLKFPIGQYKTPDEISPEHIHTWIETIEKLPKKLILLTKNLSNKELEYQYRPQGWTIKQVVHHLADSHMNSFMRFKLMLTEENPTIKPYNEALWAETGDANNDNIQLSLSILEGLHARWTIFLRNVEPTDFERTYYHPEDKDTHTMKWMLGLYNWHCQHHLAHIEQALKCKGDFNLES